MEDKKNQHITGLGKDPENKLIVQKARPFFSLWQSDLNLSEFKILDIYLSRINTRDPEHRTVKLKKGEIEKILGVKEIKKDDLNQRLRNLHNSVRFDRPEDEHLDEQDKLRNISLFEETAAYRSKDGEWEVELTCSQAARKYIFNIEQLGYFRYKLRSIAKMKSLYTYVLFLYLEMNRVQISWVVSLNELKSLLKCENEENYKEYKRFNDKILKRCQAEIHEKTSCRFTYTPVRSGRKVTAIRFTLEPLAKILPKEVLADMPELPEDMTMHKEVLFLSGACNNEFSKKEMEFILNLVNSKSLPERFTLAYDSDMAKYYYLQEKYSLMTIHAEKKEISNRFGYFVAILKNGEEKEEKSFPYKKTNAHYSGQRKDNYEDIFVDLEND